MKAVMYHYVRRGVPSLPHMPYLDADDFVRQLDYFEQTVGVVHREAFQSWVMGGAAPTGALLTFDDGLRDHVEVVLPILRARRLFGIFYVPSGPALTGEILDVHKIHLSLGRLGGPAALAWLQSNASGVLPSEGERLQIAKSYLAQSSDDAEKIVKHLFNWQLSAEKRRAPLDGLLTYAFDGAPPNWRSVYVDEAGIHELLDAGMGVGPHGHTHIIPSRASVTGQREEIETSCNFIDHAGGSRAWGYCYPHGRPEALTEQSKELVSAAGCPFAFAVSESMEINTLLAASERFSLPRNDCAIFPHGRASRGSERAPREDRHVQ